MELFAQNFQITKPMYCQFYKDGDILVASQMALKQMMQKEPADLDVEKKKIWTLAWYNYKPNEHIFVLLCIDENVEMFEVIKGVLTRIHRQNFVFRQPKTPVCAEGNFFCMTSGSDKCKHECLENKDLSPCPGPLEQWEEPQGGVERDGSLYG